MASVISDPGGRMRIQLFNPAGVRKTIRVGKMNAKQARAVAAKLETIIADQIGDRAHEPEVMKWLRDLDPRLLKRLVRAGVTTQNATGMRTLSAFLTEFFAALEVKPGTTTSYRNVERNLFKHFGRDAAMRSIGPADAEKFRQFLKNTEKLSDATVSRRIKIARQFFRRAVKWNLISDNPFSDVKAGTERNKSRLFFVSSDVAQKVLDACPDLQWRLLFALSRYGGLRCPSEHLALKFEDINWDQGKFYVSSSKTEHHEGGEGRWVPIFPELRPYLLEALEQAEPGTKHVITKYRSASCNLRTQLLRIIKRAGVTAWPRLFQNLRSTRQTELCEKYAIHLVCAWIGNSAAVAMGHYLQVTDQHFKEASMTPEEKLTLQAAQKPAESGGNDRKGDAPDTEKTSVSTHEEGLSSGRSRTTNTAALLQRNTASRRKVGAESGAVTVLRGSERRDAALSHLSDEQRMRMALDAIEAAERAMFTAQRSAVPA
jgi:integrase